MRKHCPLVLAILDGWGLAKPGPSNAISLADTPNMVRWTKNYPHTHLAAFGQAVGLTGTTTGNSEVGHLNIGAGYIVAQSEVRINTAIASGDFYANQTLLEACQKAGSEKKNLHILSMAGPGQVHGSIEHLWAMLALTQKQELSNVYVHLFSDGRDASPNWLGKNAEAVQGKITNLGGIVASLCGRYYAMDRDARWDRTEIAYKLLTERKGLRSADLSTAVEHSYQKSKTDEFIEPTVIGNGQTIKDGDVVIFLNYRADRARQLSQAFVNANFDGFERPEILSNLHFYTMTEYQADLSVSGVAFGPQPVSQPLAKVLSDAGLRQLHIAESEKHAHVTYFINGGNEQPFPGEIQQLIPSPKVATYDLKPEMSAQSLTAEVVKHINEESFDIIILNFANPDMVAHTGNLLATIKAVEVVDDCLGQIEKTLRQKHGVLVITADHGNAEVLMNSDNTMDTQHNSGNVPFIIVGEDLPGELKPGVLADVTPTLLALLEIQPPKEMTAQSLWIHN